MSDCVTKMFYNFIRLKVDTCLAYNVYVYRVGN